MKKLLIATTLILAPTLAQAEEVKAKVNGIICAYCVQGIEKAFKKLEEVEHVKVDLDNGLVTIHTKGTNDLADAKVKSIITDAGYTVTGIERHS